MSDWKQTFRSFRWPGERQPKRPENWWEALHEERIRVSENSVSPSHLVISMTHGAPLLLVTFRSKFQVPRSSLNCDPYEALKSRLAGVAALRCHLVATQSFSRFSVELFWPLRSFVRTFASTSGTIRMGDATSGRDQSSRMVFVRRDVISLNGPCELANSRVEIFSSVDLAKVDSSSDKVTWRSGRNQDQSIWMAESHEGR